MGRVFVAGHGVDPGGPHSFVPDGVVLHFHADVNTKALATLSTAVLATGAAAGSLQEYGPGEQLPNYRLSKFSDAEMTARLTAVNREAELVLVGNTWFDAARVGLPSPVRLCSTPEKCGQGRHSCAGVLGVLPAAGYEEIHILACREREWDGSPQTTYRMAGESKPDSFWQLAVSMADELASLAAKDAREGTHEAEAFFDAFQPEEQAIMFGYAVVQAWSYNRHARDFVREYGDDTFYRFHFSQPANEQAYHLQDATLRAAIGRARAGYLQQLAAAGSAEQRAVILEPLSVAVRADVESMERDRPARRQKIRDDLAVIEKFAEAMAHRIEVCRYQLSKHHDLWAAQVDETRRIAEYARVAAALADTPEESLPEAQETLRDLLTHMMSKHERMRNALTDHREVWNTDTQPSLDALHNARRGVAGAKRRLAMALSFEATDRQALFTSAYTTFIDALNTAEETFIAARETFNVSADSYEGATSRAIDLDVMQTLRQLVLDVGADDAAHPEFHQLDDDTRQHIQDTAATSLDALEHMRAALTALLEIYRTQAARIADVQRAFHDTTTALVPTG
ncbi:MAG: hypothetical protein H0T78_08910 [Longispora sp.]|nr:hypothetical protein [Longispora sp. (in: high G+C Gram-positive bacteria)]